MNTTQPNWKAVCYGLWLAADLAKDYGLDVAKMPEHQRAFVISFACDAATDDMPRAECAFRCADMIQKGLAT